jgi:L-histidine N-alpha-methyltransferase
VIRPGDQHAQIPITGAAITAAETTTDRVTVEVNLPPGGPLSGMAADVRAGLTRPFKELSPRYFYDEHGSELFERITELEEYYPTRCEREILQTGAAEICEAANRPASLIELGSGSARKTRALLDAMRCAGCLKTYCPVDISEEITRDTAERIAREYEGVNVRGLVCDFEFDLERIPVGGPRVIALLGGTIGNFAPHQRAGFLRRISNLLGPEDRFLLGTDLVKEPAILEAAYNDSKGVTAEFNKNVLAVLNRELGADFDLDSFEHVARWDPENLWMDIRLRSLVNQVVNVSALNMLVPFAAGEEMRTEISTKFLRPGLEGIYAEAGLELTDWWTDAEGLYALSLARSASSSS